MRGRLGAALLAAMALVPLAHAQETVALVTAPDVLVQDPSTLSAWRGSRERLAAGISGLRSASGDAAASSLAAASEAMRADMAAFSDLASRLAQEDKPEIDAEIERTNRLLDNLVRDHADGERVHVDVTLRMIEESLASLESLAVRSDSRLGRRPSTEVAAVPADWGEPQHPDAGFPAGLALLDAGGLRTELASRRAELAKETRARLVEDHRRIAGEIGVMAHALVARQGDVPALSRRGFVNCALRIEVLSDNLVARLDEGDRLAFRRQLIALRDALEDLDGYLSVEATIAEPVP